MTTSITVILAVLVVFLAYTLLAPILLNVGRFTNLSWIYCPTHLEYGRVKLNPIGAALTSAYGAPDLHVRKCSLLKPGETCEEKCLVGADL